MHQRFFRTTTAVIILVASAVPAFAHDVKDPVCRMTVDSDTTLYRMTLGNKTYYFCSAHCRDEFKKSPKTYVTIADLLASGKKRGYTISMRTVPHPIAGKPTPMAFAVRYADTHDLVPKFELTHQELMHFMMMSDDMRWFEHQHPYRDADGLFHFTWTFPHPGLYDLFFDYTPADGDNQVQRLTLDVGPGTHKPKTPKLPAMASSIEASGMAIALSRQPKALHSGDTVLFTYTFTDKKTGRPVSDMQPFIGAMGHLMIVRDDRKTFKHTHVVGGVAKGSYQAVMLQMTQAGHSLVVTPDMDTPTGPKFTFKFTLPPAGNYMTWAQFMHDNKVVTAPFALHVLPAETVPQIQ
jgi:YHS domain-containing protein